MTLLTPLLAQILHALLALWRLYSAISVDCPDMSSYCMLELELAHVMFLLNELPKSLSCLLLLNLSWEARAFLT